MRWLIVNTDGPGFVARMYGSHAGLAEQPYSVQQDVRHATWYGVNDFYPKALAALGISADVIYADNEPMQRAWMREHAPHDTEAASKVAHSQRQRSSLPLAAVARRIHAERPDVVIVQEPTVSPAFWETVRDSIGVLVLQIPCAEIFSPLWRRWLPQIDLRQSWDVFDLVISSHRSTVAWFAARGMPAFLNRLGFDPRVLRFAEGVSHRDDATFCGSLHAGCHSRRARLLREVGRRHPITIYAAQRGSWLGKTPRGWVLRPPVYGAGMYRVLAGSRITLNHHGNVREGANNLRLYEATGVGALLLTDWQPDLHEIFEPEAEVVTYRSSEECVDKLRFYLSDERARGRIASAGQRRTLAEHTYERRMGELVAELQRRQLL